MFVEHKEAIEVSEAEVVKAPAKTMKLSEAIKIGSALLGRDRKSWCFCAIGAAHRALTGRIFDPDDYGYKYGDIVEQWAADHGFDPIIAREAEQQHEFHNLDHLEVADWLEAKGY